MIAESSVRIRDILKRIRIHSITDPDPASDPDAALSASGFQDANKKSLFLNFFYLFLSVRVHLHRSSKITSH